jgi:hypothetical protein
VLGTFPRAVVFPNENGAPDGSGGPSIVTEITL